MKNNQAAAHIPNAPDAFVEKPVALLPKAGDLPELRECLTKNKK